MSNEAASQVAYAARVLKTPTIAGVFDDLADTARQQGWTYEEYLAAVLGRQVADREASGMQVPTRPAHFPQVKTLEDFNVDHQPSLRRDVLAHLATSTYIGQADNVVLLGPPGVGKTHLAIALGHKAIASGYAVQFDTAVGWLARLQAAHASLEAELRKLRRHKLLIIDEVGYIPFDSDAANLFFQFVAHRYGQGSILVTSNMPFGWWGGDLRRRHRRRRHDRPPRPPRRSPHPRRAVLPN